MREKKKGKKLMAMKNLCEWGVSPKKVVKLICMDSTNL